MEFGSFEFEAPVKPIKLHIAFLKKAILKRQKTNFQTECVSLNNSVSPDKYVYKKKPKDEVKILTQNTIDHRDNMLKSMNISEEEIMRHSQPTERLSTYMSLEQ